MYQASLLLESLQEPIRVVSRECQNHLPALATMAQGTATAAASGE